MNPHENCRAGSRGANVVAAVTLSCRTACCQATIMLRCSMFRHSSEIPW